MLKEKRRILGISQKELGERLGKSESYVSRLENKVLDNPNVEIILKLSEELNLCPVKIFLFFAGLDCKLDKKYCKKFKCRD